MNNYYQSFVVSGEVVSKDDASGVFKVELLTGDKLTMNLSSQTSYDVLKNIGEDSRDRVLDASDGGNKYIIVGEMVTVEGNLSMNNNIVRYDARSVVLMDSISGSYGWESDQWWLYQISTLFEQWLDVLFGSKRVITKNDFAECYRTDLDLLGGKTNNANEKQECATMSRFLYGLSSSYLLTGNERSLHAARSCAEYLMESFTIISHDRQHCFWKYAREHDGSSRKDIIASQNGDDLESFALYEQIYALSGLTQYYRVSQDTKVLEVIRMTIASFETYFRDVERPNDPCYTGAGGYFSHLDTVTYRPDSVTLKKHNNDSRKNWNSIGDHIPAYMVNLILAIDPLPEVKSNQGWKSLLTVCRDILDHNTRQKTLLD